MPTPFHRNQLTVFLLLLASMFAGCSEDATSDHSTSTGEAQYDWFFVNYNAYSHNITIDVNDKPFMSFTDGSGFDSKPTPLIAGENRVMITCEPKAGQNFPNTFARILLSPTMMPGTSPTPGVEMEQIENYTEIDLTIDINNQAPESFRYTHNEWSDNDKQTMLYQLQVDKDEFMRRPLREQVKVWNEDGRPFREVQYEDGNILNASYYKPDGSIGAQVTDGAGDYREWFADGTVSVEASIQAGQYAGVVKEYAEDGSIAREVSAEQWLRE